MNSSNLDTYTWSFELIVGSSQLLGLRSRLSKLIKSSSPHHFLFFFKSESWNEVRTFGLELGRALKVLISSFFFFLNYQLSSYHHIPATIKQKYCTNSTVNEYSFFPSGGAVWESRSWVALTVQIQRPVSVYLSNFSPQILKQQFVQILLWFSPEIARTLGYIFRWAKPRNEFWKKMEIL